MSMRIQETLQNCCKGITDFATRAVAWTGKTITNGISYAGAAASRANEAARPYLAQVKAFAQENRKSLLVAGIAVIVGAIGAVIANNVFCRGTNQPAPAPVPVPVAAPAVVATV